MRKKTLIFLAIPALVAAVLFPLVSSWKSNISELKDQPATQSIPDDRQSAPDFVSGQVDAKGTQKHLMTNLTGVPRSIIQIIDQPGADDTFDRAAVQSYLQSEQGSPYTGPLLLRLGKELYSAGSYSESLSTLETAWKNVLTRMALF